MTRRLIIAYAFPGALPSIPTPGLTATVTSTSAITLTASYTGPPALSTYTFYSSPTGASPWTLLATQTSPTYVNSGLSAGATVYYYCTVQTSESPSRTSQPSATVSATLTVTITTASLPNATLDSAYSTPIAAIGGTGSYTLSITSQPGPNTWTASGVNLKGTPLTADTESLVLKMTDSVGNAGSATLGLTTNAGAGYSFAYYISPTGSDSNPGTLSQPWAITSLLYSSSNRSLYAGKAVGIIAGTYACASYTNAYGYSNTVPGLDIAAGSSGSPTIIASCNSSGNYINPTIAGVANVAILDGTGTTVNAPLIGQRYTGGGYVTLDGLQVQNGNTYLVSFVYQGAASASYAAGITIKNCSIHDQVPTGSGGSDNPACIFFQGVTGAYVGNCKLYNSNSAAAGDHGANGLICYESVSVTAEWNTVYNCSNGIYGKGAGYSYDNQGALLRYNYIECTTSTGNAFQNWNNAYTGGWTVTAYNNIAWAPWGFWLYALGSSGQSPTLGGNFSLTNNTLYNPGTQGYGMLLAPCSGSGYLTSYSNIIASGNSSGSGGNSGEQGYYEVYNDGVAYSDYNLFPASLGTGASKVSIATKAGGGTGGISGFPTLYSLSGFQTALAAFSPAPTANETHSITGTPTWAPTSVTPTSFQLPSGSPGKSAGKDGTDMGAWGGPTAPTTDGQGHATPTIGANF